MGLNVIFESLGFLYLSFLGGWLIACKSLLEHTVLISPKSDGDLPAMRQATAMIVGRDTSAMDEKGCRRAGIESLSESFVDGILTPLVCFAGLGIGGIVIFKVISTMDSMVGYRNERYHQFGWAGARLDDLFNWIPARLSWLVLSAVAFIDPRLYGKKALWVGWNDQHVLPGYNSGWPEATTAGALNRRLVGPIWKNGRLETEVWIGDTKSPDAGSSPDLVLARHLIGEATALSCLLLFLWLLYK
jgi:adenosylcobinamide-phosphate synthase